MSRRTVKRKARDQSGVPLADAFEGFERYLLSCGHFAAVNCLRGKPKTTTCHQCAKEQEQSE